MLFLPVVMGGLFLLASLLSFALTWVQAAFFVLLTLRLYQPEGTSLPSLGERGDANRTVSMKSLLAALVAGTLVAGVTGFFLVDSVRMDDDVLVIAHRGASGRAPENTLAALAAAIEDGADLLEIDVQETIDGEVVVIHDSDFMKIAGDPRKVWDVTYEETRTIDIGSWFGPEFSAQRLPTLEEVLELAKRSETAIYTIGLKSGEDSAKAGFRESDFVLRELAQETGGRSFFPDSAEDLAGIYQLISDELSSQYALGYVSSNPLQNGRWRRIIVRVDRDEVQARTKQGYYGPAGN